MKNNFADLAELYQYFDVLAEQDADADILFASSYVRGFVSLAACDFGDEAQKLTLPLAKNISDNLESAKTELSPQDRLIVNQYWQSLLPNFIAE